MKTQFIMLTMALGVISPSGCKLNPYAGTCFPQKEIHAAQENIPHRTSMDTFRILFENRF